MILTSKVLSTRWAKVALALLVSIAVAASLAAVTSNKAYAATKTYSKPAITSVSLKSKSAATLKWKTTKGAVKYQVFYSTSKAKNFKRAATTAKTIATVYKMKLGTTYYFKVVALNKKSKTVSTSAVKSIKTAPAKTELTYTKVASTKIKLDWEKASGASGYRVQYQIGRGAWKTLANTIKLTYAVNNLSVNTTYKFRVIPYVKNANKITLGSISDACIWSVKVLPGKTTILKAHRLNGYDTNSVELKWTKAKNTDYYLIQYQCEGENRWRDASTAIGESTTSKTIRMSLAEKYKFRIIPTNKGGKGECTNTLTCEGQEHRLVWIAYTDISKCTACDKSFNTTTEVKAHKCPMSSFVTWADYPIPTYDLKTNFRTEDDKNLRPVVCSYHPACLHYANGVAYASIHDCPVLRSLPSTIPSARVDRTEAENRKTLSVVIGHYVIDEHGEHNPYIMTKERFDSVELFTK